jgi:hypothetical protein
MLALNCQVSKVSSEQCMALLTDALLSAAGMLESTDQQ